MMTDHAPLSVVETDDFPDDDPPVRVCEEDGCEQPCKKRGRGYARWCEDHLFNHSGDDSKPRSRRTVEDVAAKRSRVEKKASDQTKALLAPLQMIFIGKNDMYCAAAIGELAEPIANSMGAVAADFKFVANMIDKTDKYFALTMLTMNVTRLALIIGTHHDLVPYSGPIKLLVPEPPKKVIDASFAETSNISAG